MKVGRRSPGEKAEEPAPADPQPAAPGGGGAMIEPPGTGACEGLEDSSPEAESLFADVLSQLVVAATA